MAQINITGDIIRNDDKWIYRWLGWDCTCPRDVQQALDSMEPDDRLEVDVNSGGGDVFAGQEIYSILHGRDDVDIVIQSLAGSAASVIAMANHSIMSPVAMIMIHNVAMYGAGGDYHEMQHNAEILKRMNSALAQAYVAKTGRPEDEILKLMDKETWLTANQALSLGFVDALTESDTIYTNAVTCGPRLTDEIRQRVIREKAEKEAREKELATLKNDLYKYGI